MLSFETDLLLMRPCLVSLNFRIDISLSGFNAKEYGLHNLRAALVTGILEDPAVLETIAKDPVTYGCHVLCHYFICFLMLTYFKIYTFSNFSS